MYPSYAVWTTCASRSRHKNPRSTCSSCLLASSTSEGAKVRRQLRRTHLNPLVDRDPQLYRCKLGVWSADKIPETPEGLDRMFALNFYSRLRFTENMLPLLREAAKGINKESNNGQPSRLASVVSVLGAGRERAIDMSDPSLKYKYSQGASTQHATTMTTLAFARLAADHNNAGIAFFHTRPGMVKTNGDRELGTPFRALLWAFTKVFGAWTVPVQDAGERGLWAASNGSFHSGQLHLISENSEQLSNSKVLKRLEEDGSSSKIWAHTRDVFQAICNNPTGTYQP